MCKCMHIIHKTSNKPFGFYSVLLLTPQYSHTIESTNMKFISELYKNVSFVHMKLVKVVSMLSDQYTYPIDIFLSHSSR